MLQRTVIDLPFQTVVVLAACLLLPTASMAQWLRRPPRERQTWLRSPLFLIRRFAGRVIPVTYSSSAFDVMVALTRSSSNVSAACLDVRNKSSADSKSLVSRDTQVGHICMLLHIPDFSDSLFTVSSHPSDLKTGTHLANLPGALR